MCKYTVIAEDEWGNFWPIDDWAEGFDTIQAATEEAERVSDYLEDNPRDSIVVVEILPIKKLASKKTWKEVR